MSRALICLVAFVLLGIQVHAESREAGVTGWINEDYTSLLTGPAIVWKYLISDEKNAKTISEAIVNDTQNNLKSAGYWYWCWDPSVKDMMVNDSGMFVDLNFFVCRKQDFHHLMVDTPYPTTSYAINQILQSTYSNMSVLWGGLVPDLTWTYLQPGFLPIPPPPGVSSNTTNKQTILLSGDYTTWQLALKEDSKENTTTVSDAIAADISVTLGHYGCVVMCTIDSIEVHTADPTKMLPGNGMSGLTVNVTINQGITNSSVYQYDQHTISSALMSATMSETTKVYNAAAGGTTVDAIQMIAAYEDMVYSPLDCAWACVIAITVLISAVYLMMIIAIITIVATKCYLVNDFDFMDIWNDYSKTTQFDSI